MTRFALIAALALAAAPALADTTPPAGALKLSDVIAKVEARPDLAHVEEIDWDDDGYWNVEYRTTADDEVKLRLDPLTGEPRT